MEWIEFDVWDYAENQNEICEQILYEFGKKVAIAIRIPSERERVECWQRMHHIEPNNIIVKINGKEIKEDKLERARTLIAEAYKMPKKILFEEVK